MRTGYFQRQPAPFVVLATIIWVIVGGDRIDAELWRCPCGGEDHPLDDRDPAFKESFKRRHIVAHCNQSFPAPLPPGDPVEERRRELLPRLVRPALPSQERDSQKRDELLSNLKRPTRVELDKAAAVKTLKGKTRAVSWTALWNSYQDARMLATGIAPEANRCAIALSAALDVRPRRASELTLADVPDAVNAAFRGASVLNRYYIRASELAERLREDPPFGRYPEIFENPREARERMTFRRGIVYFEDGDFRPSRLAWSGDHIDVWNELYNGSPYAFNLNARRIWFWEFPAVPVQ